jgi:hypothetical protein
LVPNKRINVSQGIFWQPQVGARIIADHIQRFLPASKRHVFGYAQKKRLSSMKTWWHHGENVVLTWKKPGATMVAFA